MDDSTAMRINQTPKVDNDGVVAKDSPLVNGHAVMTKVDSYCKSSVGQSASMSGQSVSTSGSAGLRLVRLCWSTPPASDNTLLRLIHLDINADDAVSSTPQDAATESVTPHLNSFLVLFIV
ncbi:hypothetical protein LINGRAHAP2_LOCUS2509 [Linum grandiflorum]